MLVFEFLTTLNWTAINYSIHDCHKIMQGLGQLYVEKNLPTHATWYLLTTVLRCTQLPILHRSTVVNSGLISRRSDRLPGQLFTTAAAVYRAPPAGTDSLLASDSRND